MMGIEQRDNVVLLASGGIKSAVAAMRELSDSRCHFLYIDDGSPASARERRVVRGLADGLASELHVVEIREHGYEGGMGQGTSRFMGRILTWFGIAQSLALRIGADRIVSGVSQRSDEVEQNVDHNDGDPAARHVLLHAIQTAIELSIPGRRLLPVESPFVDVSLDDIIRLGLRMGVPFHLTWSCRESGDKPCGTCSACVARAEAFGLADVEDPALSQAIHQPSAVSS